LKLQYDAQLSNFAFDLNLRHYKTADDPGRRKPDITKAKELLGWEPKVMLRQAGAYTRPLSSST
jgi:nucleoside-diphosphate-sugar epimerase